jgi:hypothetical protein
MILNFFKNNNIIIILKKYKYKYKYKRCPPNAIGNFFKFFSLEIKFVRFTLHCTLYVEKKGGEECGG